MANKTVTVKSSGGTYMSLQAALTGEKAANADLVAMAGILTIECYDLGSADGAVDTGIGWTTSASYYINIVAPVGQRHDGKWNASKYRIEMSGSSGSVGAFTNRAAYTRLTGIQIKRSTTASFDVLYGFYNAGGTSTLLDKCLIWFRVDHGSGIGRGHYVANVDSEIRNSVVFLNGVAGTGGTGFDGLVGGSAVQTVTNCTVYGWHGGISTGSGTVTIKNTVVQNPGAPTFPYFLGGATQTGCDYNLSDQADAPGSTVYNGKTVLFVNAAAGDFHLHASDTEAVGKGTDLSGTFTDDIDGETRSAPWALGADQAAGALASGTASGSATGSTTASLSVGTGSGGTGPYTYQWYRDTSPGFTASGANDIVGATSTTLSDTGLTASTAYYYQCVVTDAVAATATSNEVTVTTTAVSTGRPRRATIIL